MSVVWRLLAYPEIPRQHANPVLLTGNAGIIKRRDTSGIDDAERIM
jgi:hypothetical protein